MNNEFFLTNLLFSGYLNTLIYTTIDYTFTQ